jgi:hypothetical protein
MCETENPFDVGPHGPVTRILREIREEKEAREAARVARWKEKISRMLPEEVSPYDIKLMQELIGPPDRGDWH